MTSLLPSASSSVLGQNVSGCRHLGADCWDFYAPAFFILFYFFQAIISIFFWLIWINPCAPKDLFAIIILITNWSHMKNKGIKQKSKKKGSDNAFGCDLIEHLESSGQDGKSLTLLYFLFMPLLFNYQEFLKILVNPL